MTRQQMIIDHLSLFPKKHNILKAGRDIVNMIPWEVRRFKAHFFVDGHQFLELYIRLIKNNYRIDPSNLYICLFFLRT